MPRIIPKILIAGRTGAGKSSLLNAILGKEAFPTGVRPTTMGFDVQKWVSPWGEVEVIDSRGFAEADSGAAVAGGDMVIHKGYEESHVCLLVISAGGRDFERESQWVAKAQAAGLLQIVPMFLVVSRIDEVPPARGEWNPDTLNLQSPGTPKETNIRAKLDYLQSLSAFKIFFDQTRVIAVSAGQQSKENPEFNRPPYGIKELQDKIFKILPEAVKTEYARMFRRIELVRQSVEGLISTFVKKQLIYGIVCFVVSLYLRAIAVSSSLMGSFWDFAGCQKQAASSHSTASFTNFFAFIFFLIIPLGFQFQMVRNIARRHGFEKMNLFTLFGMIRRYPSLLRKFKPSSSDWLWIIGLYCCCCSPIGLALFLTRPIAQGFNEIFYRFRMDASHKEMEEALKQ